jgi:hypothetical protein
MECQAEIVFETLTRFRTKQKIVFEKKNRMQVFCLHTHLNSIVIYLNTLGEYPCVATGTYNTMITYIQNVSYIIIRKYFIIHP